MGWFCGKKAGFIAAIVSGLIWLCANWFGGDPELRAWIGVWETGRHFGFFVVVAAVASTLRTNSDIAAARIALLEHSQRLEHEIVNISETEQQRIGQDLHDGLCQYLAALSCSARSLHDDLEKLQLKDEAETAGELATLLQDAVVQTRDLARGLVPAHVAQVGIVVALESLTQSVSRLQGINCTFRSQGPVTNCDEHTAMHLYRITQEAINNATKHGKARKIAVSLDATSKSTTLKVSDNGVGMSGFISGTGVGIMRYRARLSGGNLTIEPAQGGGTIVSCTIPSNGSKRKSPRPKPVSVVIVEDHRMFREHLAHLIDKTQDIMVAGEADNIGDGLTLVKQTRPSIAIIDITLKGASGLELIKELRAAKIDVPVLVLSMHDESLYAERALRAGANGYITKHEASADVLLAIRHVLAGEIYLNPRFMARMMSKMMSGGEPAADPIERLADRELEVFRLIGRGLTTREIGEQLGLGISTVDTYTMRIKQKLNLENSALLRLEASRWLQQHG